MSTEEYDRAVAKFDEDHLDIGYTFTSPYAWIGNGPLHAVGVDDRGRLWACEPSGDGGARYRMLTGPLRVEPNPVADLADEMKAGHSQGT